MPGRYEMVDEPEAMEVVDDDVYHPDLSVRDNGASSSLRSLEPIIAGPVGLKTIFYDPRWSNRQRKCCVGIILSVSFCCLAILISLMVGLGKVISYINQNERMKTSGLYMIPDLAEYESGIFLYNLPKSDKKYEEIAKAYISCIDDYLTKYNKTQQGPTYTDCKKGESPGRNKLCRFDFNTLGKNCTKETRYGYYDGNPCILFSVRNVRKWTPTLDDPYLKSDEVNNSAAMYRTFDTNHMPLVCSATIVQGFNTNTAGYHHFEFYPEEGFDTAFLKRTPDLEETPQVAPLVFVQLIQPQNYNELHIKCRILARNIKEMTGLRMIEFEYGTISPQSDVGMESVESN